ncbi:putative N-acetylmannosamine-6-phosphate 2-epimerase [Phormidium sp. CLA17]|uniref:putative N-acetylmannosamine-6-phosphate 2-epimerase n=1 Tax=Leptolyngbya sp. Cla-17 TaxID=2803751 RepID=UPI0014928E9E|nr:putative N-acetylmannosamine-6-phosphate 2-epimerase [Leptolyngbya sp. Cla-17]MBM0743524.1 putative N-acetylmannosamine-6-phosphate 2-epimerase [Leptolyngbya sp. Cla-17]
MKDSSIVRDLQGGLIVSCQAPAESPMHQPQVITAMAEAAINQGAIAIRLDTPAHVKAVRQKTSLPIIGLWKQQIPDFEVYITPQFDHAAAIAQAGADIIAIDATLRSRPNHETVETIIARIHTELGKLVMADVDTLEAAIAATNAGADLVGTTLYGYTADTQHLKPPGFSLLAELVKQLQVPVICEGGIASPQMAKQALDMGAYAVVVGTAITGIDLQVKAYATALKTQHDLGCCVEHFQAHQICLFDVPIPSYCNLIDTRLREYNHSVSTAQPFFTIKRQPHPLHLFLMDEHQTILGGLIGFTSNWNWLEIDLLWIDEPLRRQGYGDRLMRLAEQAAQKRGCTSARVSTLSFQAKGFYEKLGYEIAGVLADYPPGHTHYTLQKTLS